MNQTTKEIKEIINNLSEVERLKFQLGYETREAEEQEGFSEGVRRAVEFLSISEGIHDTMSHDRLYKSIMEQISIQKGGI